MIYSLLLVFSGYFYAYFNSSFAVFGSSNLFAPTNVFVGMTWGAAGFSESSLTAVAVISVFSATFVVAELKLNLVSVLAVVLG